MPDDAPPAGLPQVVPPEEVTAAANEDGADLAEREQAQIERDLAGHNVEAAALRNRLAKAYIDNVDADREMRKQYASRILGYLELYSVGVGGLVLLNGYPATGFHLADAIIASLVGSTAIAAIGLVGFVARGLFTPPPLKPPTSDQGG